MIVKLFMWVTAVG